MARTAYQNQIDTSSSYRDDIFVLNILKEEMKNDNPRKQRIILE